MLFLNPAFQLHILDTSHALLVSGDFILTVVGVDAVSYLAALDSGKKLPPLSQEKLGYWMRQRVLLKKRPQSPLQGLLEHRFSRSESPAYFSLLRKSTKMPKNIHVLNWKNFLSATSPRVLITDDVFSPELVSLSRELRRRKLSWSLFSPFGSRLTIGPHFTGESKGACFECLRFHLIRHGVFDYESNEALAHVPFCTPDIFALAQGVLLQELETFSRNPESVSGKITIVRIVGLEKEKGSFVRRLECPTCGEIRFSGGPWKFRPLPVLDSYSGFRTRPLPEMAEKLRAHVNSVTGILHSVVPKETHFQYSTLGISPLSFYSRFNIDDVTFSMGKGLTAEGAYVSCVAEAIERARMDMPVPSVCVVGTARSLKKKFRLILPDELEELSSLQMKLHQEGQLQPRTFIGPGFSESDRLTWLRSWSLTQKKEVLIPGCFVYRSDLLPEHAKKNCGANSSGQAAGANREEAVIQGTLELIERECFSVWWFNKFSLPELLPGESLGPCSRMILRRFREGGRSVTLRYARFGFRLHTVIALSSNNKGEDVTMGMGTHYDIHAAVDRAIGEMYQGTHFSVDGKEFRNSILSYSLHPYLKPGGRLRLEKLPDDFARVKKRNTLAVIKDLVAEFNNQGLELIAHDMSDSAYPLSVVKMISPGIVRHVPRFGNRRLFTLPVTCGFLRAPRSESELNKIGYSEWKPEKGRI